MKKKRPVLQDVADRVGITKMTVSRYLRNPEQVSVALRDKIAVALDELGYIPNRAPDMLSNATSRAIGVLLPSLTNQVFADVLRGIEAVTDEANYQTLVAHFGYNPQKRSCNCARCWAGTLMGLSSPNALIHQARCACWKWPVSR